MKTVAVPLQQIIQAHALYCQLTGQTLSLGFDRERMWYDLLRFGYGPEQVRRVVIYLQREIRAERRNVGALKLSNLLQPDRFEEDLNISQVRLKALQPKPSSPAAPPVLPPKTQEQGRLKALQCIRKLKEELRINPGNGNNLETSTEESDKNPKISTDQSGETSTD